MEAARFLEPEQHGLVLELLDQPKSQSLPQYYPKGTEPQFRLHPDPNHPKYSDAALQKRVESRTQQREDRKRQAAELSQQILQNERAKKQAEARRIQTEARQLSAVTESAQEQIGRIVVCQFKNGESLTAYLATFNDATSKPPNTLLLNHPEQSHDPIRAHELVSITPYNEHEPTLPFLWEGQSD